MPITDREIEQELFEMQYYDELEDKLVMLYQGLDVLEDEHDKHRDYPVDWVDPVTGDVYLSAEWQDEEDDYLLEIEELKCEIALIEFELR